MPEERKFPFLRLFYAHNRIMSFAAAQHAVGARVGRFHPPYTIFLAKSAVNQ